jgi:hypothetical protein
MSGWSASSVVIGWIERFATWWRTKGRPHKLPEILHLEISKPGAHYWKKTDRMQPNVYFNAIPLANGQNVFSGSDSFDYVYNYCSGEDATLLQLKQDEDEGSLAQRCPHKTNSKFLLSVLHQIPVMDTIPSFLCPLVDYLRMTKRRCMLEVNLSLPERS